MQLTKHTRILLVVLILLSGLLLAACGPGDIEVPSDMEHGGLEVVDALGRTVAFSELPQRIVVAGNSSLTIVDTLFLFPEAAERVTGLVEGRQKPGEFLQFVDPSFADKAVLDVGAGPEQIAPLEPDAVILRSFMADTLGRSLEQIDIPVVYLDLETPEQYFRDLATLGNLFGNEARAAEIQSFYQAWLNRLDAALQDLEDDEKPAVLVVQYSEQGGEVALNVPSVSWLQTIETELAGGLPVWEEAAQGGGWTIVNFEQIAAWDPDVILLISYGADPSQVVDGLQSEAQWQALRAVQEARLYAFPGDFYSWDQPDPRWILGVTWMATKVHPERLAGLDLTDEVMQFFGQMYGMDEASITQNIVPTLRGDFR
jgi:iron complex transport system substrate-binding protein